MGNNEHAKKLDLIGKELVKKTECSAFNEDMKA